MANNRNRQHIKRLYFAGHGLNGTDSAISFQTSDALFVKYINGILLVLLVEGMLTLKRRRVSIYLPSSIITVL
jgi:hypothetical protein